MTNELVTYLVAAICFAIGILQAISMRRSSFEDRPRL